jgi:hypothetical protein
LKDIGDASAKVRHAQLAVDDVGDRRVIEAHLDLERINRAMAELRRLLPGSRQLPRRRA